MIEEIIILMFAVIGIIIIIFIAGRIGGEGENWRRIKNRGNTRAVSFDKNGKFKRNKPWPEFIKQKQASKRIKSEVKRNIGNVASPVRNYERAKRVTKFGRDIHTMSGGKGNISIFLAFVSILLILVIVISRI